MKFIQLSAYFISYVIMLVFVFLWANSQMEELRQIRSSVENLEMHLDFICKQIDEPIFTLE